MKTTRRGFLKGLGAFALTTILPKGKVGRDQSPSPAELELKDELRARDELSDEALESFGQEIEEIVFSTTPSWGTYSGPVLWGFQPGDILILHGDEPTTARVKSVDPFRLELVADPGRKRYGVSPVAAAYRRVGPTDTTLIGSVGPLSDEALAKVTKRYRHRLQFESLGIVDYSLT